MHPLIQYLIKHGSKTLAGNKEYYEILETKDGRYISYGGDTVINEEQFRYEISENEAIGKLKEYFDWKCEVFSVKYPELENEWAEFLKENWYL